MPIPTTTLIDLKHMQWIMDVEATTTVRQAEVGAAKHDASTARPNSSKSLRRAWSPMQVTGLLR